MWNKETLAELMHKWYLEATKKMNPESYNPKAQKKYKDLTEEQKQIDRFIAEKVLQKFSKLEEPRLPKMEDTIYCIGCARHIPFKRYKQHCVIHRKEMIELRKELKI